MATAIFSSPGLLEAEPIAQSPNSLVRRALVLVQGKQTDMLGTVVNYTKKLMDSIAQASSAYIESGEDVWFFDDHEYSAKNIIGKVQGNYQVLKINEDILPHPGMTDLIGKYGLYADIEIIGESNVQRYNSGTLKPISIGVDLGGEFVPKNTIYEISAVWKGAIRGASLFSGNLPDKELTLIYALSLQDKIVDVQAQQAMERIHDVWWAFRDLVAEIMRAEVEELEGQTKQQLISQAVTDFSNEMRSRLGVATPPPAPAVEPIVLPMFSKGKPMDKDQNQNVQDEPKTPELPAQYAAQFTQMQTDLSNFAAENKALKERLERQEHKDATAAHYSALRRRGEELRSAGKLTPAAFTKLFGTDVSSAVQRYAFPVEGEKMTLDKVEAQLDYVEEFAAPVKFGTTKPGDDPNPDATELNQYGAGNPEHDKELEAFLNGGAK